MPDVADGQAAATWEPGPPSVRVFWPSIVGGAIVPLTVYYVVRHHVSSDQRALFVAGVFPAGWIAVQWVRSRRLDPIGAIVLFGFIVGVTASELLGGSAFVLKIRDSALTAMIGIASLISLLAPRPLMVHIGKALSAGDDPRRRAAYERKASASRPSPTSHAGTGIPFELWTAISQASCWSPVRCCAQRSSPEPSSPCSSTTTKARLV